MENFEETKYRKKKPSNKSKSAKRSDHKHIYENCLIRTHFHWNWCPDSTSIHFGKRCTICGKTQTEYLPSCVEYVGDQKYYRSWSAEELLTKYPNLPIVEEEF